MSIAESGYVRARVVQVLDARNADRPRWTVTDALAVQALLDALEPFARAGKKLVFSAPRAYREHRLDDVYETHRLRTGDVLNAFEVLSGAAGSRVGATPDSEGTKQ